MEGGKAAMGARAMSYGNKLAILLGAAIGTWAIIIVLTAVWLN
jgi:hypothetical protein